MIYYKGYVVNSDDVKGYYKIGRNINTPRYSEFTTEFSNRTDANDIALIRSSLGKLRSFYSSYNEVVIEDEQLIALLRKIKVFIDFDNIFEYSSFNDFDDIDGYEIIYTKVVDSEGRVFAREIKTGAVFPILNDSSFKNTYYLTTYDNISEENYDNMYALEMEIDIKDNFILRADNIVVFEDVANRNEVEDYLESFEPEYGPDTDEETIINDANSNVFAGPIEEKEEKNLSLSEENICIGQIKYYLSYLKTLDQNEYERYSGHLEYLINGFEDKDLNTPITINDFRNILSRVKFLCLFNENLKNGITTSLLKIEDDSVKRTTGSDAREFSITKLDHLYELFLSNKDSLSLKEQYLILHEFTRCYVLKIKEYSLSKVDVLNTHFKELIYYALSISDDSYVRYAMDLINDLASEEDEVSLIKHI